jgi:hypothetical protein
MTNKTPSLTLLLLVAVLLGYTSCISPNRETSTSSGAKTNTDDVVVEHTDDAKADSTAVEDPLPVEHTDDAKADSTAVEDPLPVEHTDDAKADSTAVEDPLPDDLIDGVRCTVLKEFLSKLKRGLLKIDDPIDVKGFWPNATQDYTGLQIAAKLRELEVLKGLLKAGADPNARNNMGETALHLAVGLTETEVVEVLIDAKGVDINQQDNSGFTPLHIAVLKSARLLSREKVVRLLAQHKDIDFTKKDRRGCTPLRLAEDSFFMRNFVDILKENGAQS